VSSYNTGSKLQFWHKYLACHARSGCSLNCNNQSYDGWCWKLTQCSCSSHSTPAVVLLEAQQPPQLQLEAPHTRGLVTAHVRLPIHAFRD
jgi:hypothetical protein